MSYEDTKCPCGGRKPTDTMLCDECEAEFSGHSAMRGFKDAKADVAYRRHCAVVIVTLARSRGRSMAHGISQIAKVAAGALLLLLGLAAHGQGLPPMLKARALPAVTNLLYFAATATDAAGLSSDYSTELVYTNTTRASRFVLAWDKSPGTNVITNYTVFQGRASRSYTNLVNAGTNLTATICTAPPAKTNRVFTVTTVNATNLEYSSRAGGPWLLAGKTNLCFTNPLVNALFYRPMGPTKAKAARAFINVLLQ